MRSGGIFLGILVTGILVFAALTASQAQMLSASVTDPRAKAIVQRATGK